MISDQRAKKQFRAELVEAVAAPVVGDRVNEQVPARPHHLHAIAQRHREVKHMLQRAAVEY